MSGDRTIKVGSRKSELALIQTNYVISLLKNIHPNTNFEIVTMNTLGDNILDIALPKIGEKSLFTKELESSLASGGVDFVVHSLKDLPTVLPTNMAIGAVLSREDPRDALVLHPNFKEHSLCTLPKGSVIGTSSLRRTAQLARKYPDLIVESIRGNLNTRLRKLDEQEKFQALILAAAGLIRMGWDSRISKVLDSEDVLYAVGQGALAVECRADDNVTLTLLRPLYDIETALCIISERSFLRTLEGGCSAPVAVISELKRVDDKKAKLNLTGAVWSLDGTDQLKENKDVVLEIEGSSKCEKCPFRPPKQQENEKTCSKIKIQEDNKITSCSSQNITMCSNKCDIDEVPSKKQKIEESKYEDKNIVKVLLDDPHQSCPSEMPIGSDFMGKCPFLEQYGNKLDVDSLNADIENCNELIMKCPFFKNTESNDESFGKTSQTDDNLFVGLVPHPNVPRKAFEDAVTLGNNLALSLMAKGAVEIMAKAHAHIRKS